LNDKFGDFIREKILNENVNNRQQTTRKQDDSFQTDQQPEEYNPYFTDNSYSSDIYIENEEEEEEEEEEMSVYDSTTGTINEYKYRRPPPVPPVPPPTTLYPKTNHHHKTHSTSRPHRQIDLPIVRQDDLVINSYQRQDLYDPDDTFEETIQHLSNNKPSKMNHNKRY
jgi:hypothetical protein